MSILFYCNWQNKQEWIESIKNKFKSEKIYIWPHIKDLDSINYAIVWEMPYGQLAKCKNLKIIFALGAGVDHLLKDPNLPKVPIVRLKDSLMAKRMSNYVQGQILNFQLNILQYYENMKKKKWLEQPNIIDNHEISVGVLGIGFIGTIIAKDLSKNGYKVLGFKSTKPNQKLHFPIYYHNNSLNKFISHCNIIVNCLPSTSRTKNFINTNFLKKMKRNALLINIGRGDTVNEDHLRKFLIKNKKFNVVQDVFKKEPLKKNHPLWKEKNIFITPHIAGITSIKSAINQIYKIYSLHKKNGELKNLVNINKEY